MEYLDEMGNLGFVNYEEHSRIKARINSKFNGLGKRWFVMNTKKLKLWFAGVGLGIIALTHLYMLIAGLPANMMVGHAVLNLSAGVLLAFAVFVRWFGLIKDFITEDELDGDDGV
jgi:hypothetical protein